MPTVMEEAQAKAASRDAASEPAPAQTRRPKPMRNDGPRSPVVPTFSGLTGVGGPLGSEQPVRWGAVAAGVLGLVAVGLLLRMLPSVLQGPVPMGAPTATQAPVEAPAAAPWPPEGVTPEAAPTTAAAAQGANPTALPGSVIEAINCAAPRDEAERAACAAQAAPQPPAAAPAAPRAAPPAYAPPPAAPPAEAAPSDLVPIVEAAPAPSHAGEKGSAAAPPSTRRP